MKVVIIILVLIVVGFAVAIGVGVYRATQPPSAGHGPPTKSNGEIDEDALQDWRPPPMAEIMGKLSRPFAPKLLKRAVEVSGQAGSGLGGSTPGQLNVAPSKKDMRIARLRLVAGRAAIATYQCLGGEGRTCPQAVCLCPGSATFEADDLDACPEAWRNARTPNGGDRLECRKNDDDVSIVVYPQGGVISVDPVAGEAATVSIR
jgi:hypothetical protein